MVRLKLGERDEIESMCVLMGMPSWKSRSAYKGVFGTRKEPRRRSTVPDTLVEYHIPNARTAGYWGNNTRAYLRYEHIHELEEFQRAVLWLQAHGRTEIQVLT